MNDLKQFLATVTGKTVGVLILIGIGVLVGVGASLSSRSQIAERPEPILLATTTPAQVTTVVSTPSTPKRVQSQNKSAVVQQVVQPVIQAGVSSIAQPQSLPTSTTSTTTTLSTWHTAYTYSGSNTGFSNDKTPPFSLRGSQQRINYKCSVINQSNQYGGSFGGVIQTTQDYVGRDHFASSVSCPADKTTYEYSLPASQYYLDLDSVNSNYSVTVEDYY